jgi:CspA family cold shock protein
MERNIMSETIQNSSLSGRVKWFNPKKGFGFIMGEGDKEYFFHHSEIKMQGYRTVPEGAPVTFEGILVEGKERAVNVVPLPFEGPRPYESNTRD